MSNGTDRDDMKGTSTEAADCGQSPLPFDIQGKIGKELREVYGRLLAEPLPDKFTKLLEQLGREEDKK